MLIVGYFLAVLIGLVLGLMGGGGSILTVPVLLYVFQLPPKESIAVGLGVVGMASIVGAYRHAKKGNVLFKTALSFGVCSMSGSFFGAKVLAKYLSGEVQIMLFACAMLVASYYMYTNKGKEVEDGRTPKWGVMVLAGTGVGIFTGVVGVGGGFILVPTLVLLAGVPMIQAVGTSLVIISMTSLTGWYAYSLTVETHPELTAVFTLCTMLGILGGTHLSSYFPQRTLKKMFAIFLLVMSLFMMMKKSSRSSTSQIHLPTRSHVSVLASLTSTPWPLSVTKGYRSGV